METTNTNTDTKQHKQSKHILSSSYQEMKIQCDVCEKAEATMFCPSDEAALCHGCDHTIHRANKLATKHTRFSLVHLNSKDYPLCDICQVCIHHHFFYKNGRGKGCRRIWIFNILKNLSQM